MKDYEELVFNAFRLKSVLPFSNDSAKHARVVLKHVLLNADKKVYLYTDGLRAVCDVDGEDVSVYDWEELLSAARVFLEKEGSELHIKIASPEESEIASKQFLGLKDEYSGHVSIEWGAKLNISNFMVNDSGAFRFEREGHQAIACANNLEVSSRLIGFFDTSNVS